MLRVFGSTALNGLAISCSERMLPSLVGIVVWVGNKSEIQIK
jgi:hypothetical protein